MAIIRMGHASDVTDDTFIPGAYSPFEWRNDRTVSIGNSDIYLATCEYGAMFLYSTHHGLCLADHERNGYHDSDFIMTIWDEEAQAPFEYEYASTRGWSYPCYGSNVDATPEVRAAYEAWRSREWSRTERIETKLGVFRVLHDAAGAHKGAICRVARGRKVPKGTTGKVLSLSERQGYTGKLETWALLATETGFTPVLAQHLDLVTAAPEMLQLAFDVSAAA